MAGKNNTIIIKKIQDDGHGGHHGGGWKVAYADFMTAMMAFFLVMWLVNATEDVKQNVSDYFSTPSVIEYNFSNYGVELTLEKLFLDLMNEPLRFFEQFITPADHTPNMMMMGTKKIVMHHIADTLGDVAQNVEVHEDQIDLDLPADVMFVKGTGDPSRQFVDIMQKVKELTEGLEDSNIYIDSRVVHRDADLGQYGADDGGFLERAGAGLCQRQQDALVERRGLEKRFLERHVQVVIELTVVADVVADFLQQHQVEETL